MPKLTATETKSQYESLRYLLDYTLDLSVGESLVSITVSVTSLTDSPPTLLINNIVLAPAISGQVTMATFFANAGLNGNSYEVDFLATTSIGQVIETVVQFVITSKT